MRPPVPRVERGEFAEKANLFCCEAVTTGVRYLTGDLSGDGNGNSGNAAAASFSCADLVTSSQRSKKLRSQASITSVLRTKNSRPPFRGNPVALPPLGNERGTGADFGSHGSSGAVGIFRAPQLYDGTERRDFVGHAASRRTIRP